MPKVQRMGDSNSGGGVIDEIPEEQDSIYANGELVAVDGSRGTGHGRGIHGSKAWETANGASNVLIAGIPVNAEGDADTCGHVREDGSPDVFIG